MTMRNFHCGVELAIDDILRLDPRERAAYIERQRKDAIYAIAEELYQAQAVACSVATPPIDQRVVRLSFDVRVSMPRGHWITADEIGEMGGIARQYMTVNACPTQWGVPAGSITWESSDGADFSGPSTAPPTPPVATGTLGGRARNNPLLRHTTEESDAARQAHAHMLAAARQTNGATQVSTPESAWLARAVERSGHSGVPIMRNPPPGNMVAFDDLIPSTPATLVPAPPSRAVRPASADRDPDMLDPDRE